MNPLSDRIRSIRNHRKLGQKQVAAKMGITQQSYSWFESRSEDIKVGTLKRFCDAVGVSPGFVLSEAPITDVHINAFNSINFAP